MTEESLRTHPWRYPGAPQPTATVLGLDDELVVRRNDRLEYARVGGVPLDEALVRVGVSPVGGRYPVAAFGSNADPRVLRRKFAEGGVSFVAPLVPGTLSGATLAASAHVSRPGYIAAAAQAAPGRVLAIVVAWLDREQLDCLTETEPNYRTAVVAGVAELAHGEVLEAVMFYNTWRGIIRFGVEDVRTQEVVWRRVLAKVPELGSLLGLSSTPLDAELRSMMLRLAAHPRLRLEATRLLEPHASASGFADGPAQAPTAYGETGSE
jgi:hypothetical protein